MVLDILADIESKDEVTYEELRLDDLKLELQEINIDADPVGGKIGDDEVPTVRKSKVKKGDIWILGDHRLMCGDCTSVKNVKQLTEPSLIIDNISFPSRVLLAIVRYTSIFFTSHSCFSKPLFKRSSDKFDTGNKTRLPVMGRS